MAGSRSVEVVDPAGVDVVDVVDEPLTALTAPGLDPHDAKTSTATTDTNVIGNRPPCPMPSPLDERSVDLRSRLGLDLTKLHTAPP